MIRPLYFSRFGLAFVVLLGLLGSLQAQHHREARERALKFLQENPAVFELLPEDVADTRITDAYLTKHNQITHVWIQQQHLGLPVFNALIGLHVAANGKVFHHGHRFVPELARKVNTNAPSLSAAQALDMAMLNLNLQGVAAPSLKTKINDRNWVFEGGQVSKTDIPVSACYVSTTQDGVRLAWTMTIDQVNSADYWTICVDAQMGTVLRKINHTHYCQAGSFARENDCPEHGHHTATAAPEAQSMNQADERYNVFALPIESPNHGARSIVTNPADLNASPFGWHDTNGVPGAEFTYTRGNNVWAFEDRMNDNTPSEAESADGGAALNFDFPFDFNAAPINNRNAAITNLFYMNNMVHDFTYRYGFDEEAGNFQVNNYGQPGQGGDAVLAQALDGSDLAQPTLNNANFSTPPDGSSGRMQMYLWNTTGGGIVKVNAPSAVQGTYYGGQGGWGGAITSTPLTAEAVVINDGIEPTIGCDPALNNLTGKIVLIDRGECEFGFKAYLAEQAGAAACIICDHGAPPITGFGAGDYGGQVTIPALWMRKSDCDIIRQYAGAGLNISLVQPTVAGPAFVDGDFDNGIIAHEFGHGVSNRLTGGPSNTGCLGNPEQMGEGWSDFFTLVTTIKPGDNATTNRGVGTFVYRQSIDAQGIRRYPYNTNMSVNPITFATVAENPAVHPLGEIWAAMLWDLYWAMVEKYGYDPDINNFDSGNGRTLRLVMDGMKLQPCDPGFQDGRDAIMLADIINYNGADTCLISTVFARRGLGYLASQNDPFSATDGLENFDPIPTCVKELKIKKVALTPQIEAGENAEFAITVTNHRGEDATNVVVTDELPAGASLVNASNGGSVVGNMVVWNLGTVANGQVIQLTYTAKTDPNVGSQRFFYDPMDTDENWYSVSLDPTNIELFVLQNDEVYKGTAAWRAPNSSNLETDFALESTQQVTVNGAQPVLRFWHQFNTEPSADAGFLEFRDETAANPVWRRVTSDVTFRNGYSGKVSYNTFAIPNHFGFSGNSNGWIQSYFDMSAYSGKLISFRYRFGTDNNTAPANGRWIVDEMEFIDMVNYDTEACVSMGGVQQACDRAESRGVIVDPLTVGTDEVAFSQTAMMIQPNPAHEFMTVTLAEDMPGDVNLRLFSTDGRQVAEKQLNNTFAGQAINFDLSGLPKGMYLIQLSNAQYRSSAKVIVR